jgi:hypothetical protein
MELLSGGGMHVEGMERFEALYLDTGHVAVIIVGKA